jgi:UDP-N-acetylglucosamine/UDP-N-acetylgalactosamine 4-epimerase
MTKYEELEKYLKRNQHTWLITGVGGFIGSNLLEKLLILNQKVVGLDNFITGHRSNIDKALSDVSFELQLNINNIKQNFTLIEGDITKLTDCQSACAGIDYVLHQAALGSVPRSIENPINTNKANIEGFLNMLIAAKDAKVARFVYASSSSVYGDHPDLPKIENIVGSPLNPYAVTKVVNELYAQVFSKSYNFKTIGLRYFNVFGKRQDPNGVYAAVIPRWINNSINKKNSFINGDGHTSRDFCYIENAIQINLLAALAKNDSALDQVYNVGLNDQTTLNDLLRLIQNSFSDPNPKDPIYKDFRAGDVRHSRAEISKAKNLLGYSPKWNVAEGIIRTVEWYVKNSN